MTLRVHRSPAPAIPAASPAASGQVPNPASPPGAPPSPPGPQPPPGVPEFSPFDQRFRPPRTAFNKYARSGGSDKRNFARAIASYVSRAGGGSKTAARRMASDKRAATRLGNILSQAGESGIREILPNLNQRCQHEADVPDLGRNGFELGIPGGRAEIALLCLGAIPERRSRKTINRRSRVRPPAG
jgi:hypothetical protein